jgi:ligand-binding sensor domain-containing protein
MDKRDALIGTTQGVYTFDGEKFSSFEILKEDKSDVGVSTTKMVHSIIQDSKGKMWFATNGGVYL